MTAALAMRLVAVMMLWALCFPMITVGLNLAPHLAFATMRAVLAGLALLAAALILRRPFPTDALTWAVLSVIGLGATSLGFLGMFHAAEFISPGLATVIANAQPLLAAVLAYAVLGESLTRKGMAGLAIGFAGIVSMALPGMGSGAAGGYLLGVGYIGLAAAGSSVAYVAMKRLSGDIDPSVAMGLQLLLGAVPLALVSALTEDWGAITWSAEFVLILVVLSVVGTSVAFWLWFSALKLEPLNRANAFTFLVPIFGLAIGALFFDERLSLAQAAGVALVVAGIALVQLSPPRQHLRPGASLARRTPSDKDPQSHPTP